MKDVNKAEMLSLGLCCMLFYTFINELFKSSYFICEYLRFKLHDQVMDNTGYTSFILFDKNVSTYVGKSIGDLIDAQV